MKIEYLTELDVRFNTNADKGRRWQLIAPFVFTVDGERFTVPAGFWTDFASIPRALWRIISPYDIGKGPVPHDFGYYTGLKGKAFWDSVLLACMEYEDVAGWKHQPVYQAVNWFGGWTWDNYRKQGGTAAQLTRLERRSL